MDLDISLLSPVPCLLIRLGNRLVGWNCLWTLTVVAVVVGYSGDCTIGMHLVNGSFSGHKKISEINIVLYAEPENTIRQEIMNLVMHCFWSSSTSSPPPSPPPLLLNIQFNVAFPFLALLNNARWSENNGVPKVLSNIKKTKHCEERNHKEKKKRKKKNQIAIRLNIFANNSNIYITLSTIHCL